MPSMRITGNMSTRRYLRGIEQNLYQKNKTEEKITNNRKYTRASQSPIEAVKALKTRKALAEVITYQENLRDAGAIYDTAESAVRQISGILQTVYEKLIQGASGTYDVKDDKQIIAEEIEAHADEMVRTMNLIVADRRIFGGVNDTSLAFRIESGEVYFNGTPVNLHSDPEMFPDGKTSYMDAGMGMDFLNKYDIDPQTVIPVTFNGAKILGCGLDGQKFDLKLDEVDHTVATAKYSLYVTIGKEKQRIEFEAGADKDDLIANINGALDKSFGSMVKMTDQGLFVGDKAFGELSVYDDPDALKNGQPGIVRATPTGYPNNIIQLALDAAKCMRTGDDEQTAYYADLLFAAQSSLSLSIAKIGSDQSFIEFNQTRLDDTILGLEEMQNNLEFPDLAEESTNWKMFEAIYNATLQISSSVVPMSIFGFMR